MCYYVTKITEKFSVHKKWTNNVAYMKSYLFAPKTWKRGTQKSFIERACLVSSTEDLLNEELKRLVNVYLEKNNYPELVRANQVKS